MEPTYTPVPPLIIIVVLTFYEPSYEPESEPSSKLSEPSESSP